MVQAILKAEKMVTFRIEEMSWSESELTTTFIIYVILQLGVWVDPHGSRSHNRHAGHKRQYKEIRLSHDALPEKQALVRTGAAFVSRVFHSPVIVSESIEAWAMLHVVISSFPRFRRFLGWEVR